MKSNSSAFQQVFFTIVTITLLSGGTSVRLSAQDNLSPQQTRIVEICNTTFQSGIVAIFGLLSSKATELFRSDEEDEEKE